jgi:hypothetical protein
MVAYSCIEIANIAATTLANDASHGILAAQAIV